MKSDHLTWCRERLDELGAKPSLLDPAGDNASFALGAGAALISDKISLGFVHAKRNNVERHLKEHLMSDMITRPDKFQAYA